MRDIPRSTFAHQDEERFIPLSAGNGELILLTYLRGPKDRACATAQPVILFSQLINHHEHLLSADMSPEYRIRGDGWH